jgi:hypothetical protein
MSEFETAIRQIEDQQYQDTQRLHIVPPHYVLINPVDQADYDRLVTKDRRRVILEKGFLTNPEGQMMESGENLLAVVNDAVFQRPWSRLDLEFQINRILVYLGTLTLDPLRVCPSDKSVPLEKLDSETVWDKFWRLLTLH